MDFFKKLFNKSLKPASGSSESLSPPYVPLRKVDKMRGSVWITGKLSGNDDEADRQRIIRALEALDDAFPGNMSPSNVKMAFNNYASGESSDFDLRLVNLTVAEAEATRMKDYLVGALRREGMKV